MTYAESLPAGNPILRWAESFDEHVKVEHAQLSGKPAASSDLKEIVSCSFDRYPAKSLQRAEQDLVTPRSLIHGILRNRLHMIPSQPQHEPKLEENDYTALRSLQTGACKRIEQMHLFLIE